MKHLLILLSILLSSFLTSCEKKNGSGTETYEDGSSYVGVFKDGERNGQGTKTWSDGMYVGKYREGKLSTGIFYDKNRNISFKVVNGRMIKQ